MSKEEKAQKRDEYLRKGMELKKKGEWLEAQKAFLEAMKIEPTYHLTYAHVAATAHLLKQQNLAVRSYLALTHLQLHTVENTIIDGTLHEKLKVVYDKMEKAELAKLPLESAFIIYLDKTITRQVAHSLIDLKTGQLEKTPELAPYAEIYHAQLAGDKNWEKLLKKHNISKETFNKVEENTYVRFGQNFFIQHIDWDKVFRNDVLNIYFQPLKEEGKKNES